MNDASILQLLPEIALCLSGILIMVLDPLAGKRFPWLSLFLAAAGLLAVPVFSFTAAPAAAAPVFGGMVRLDALGGYLRLLFSAMGLLLAFSAWNFLNREKLPPGEFFALLLFALCGMNFMVISNSLFFTFIGLEILSIATYVLAGYRREDACSNEAGLKYFFTGSVSSGILLYGIALIYGHTGSFSYDQLLRYTSQPNSGAGLPVLFLTGMAFVLTGFFFKTALAPFHIWTPDVYQGAPTPVTAFMSVGPKAAGFAVLLRLLLQLTPPGHPLWQQVLIVSAVLTMIIGNLGALAQDNIKRMLAYSSIAHAGYLLLGIIAANDTGVTAILFYLAAYTLMNTGAFTIVAVISSAGDRQVMLEDYRGLGFRQPQLAYPLTVCLISLAGIPATAGFIGKFFLFSAALERHLFGLVIIAVLASLISVYYYLRVVVFMFMRDQLSTPPVKIPAASAMVGIICSLLLLVLGLYPGPLLDAGLRAAAWLWGS